MSPATNCPDPQELQRFLLGQISESDAARVESHLAQCGRCLDALRSLQGKDLLVDAVRTQAAAGPELDDQALASLIERLQRLRSLPGASSNEPTVAESRSAEMPPADLPTASFPASGQALEGVPPPHQTNPSPDAAVETNFDFLAPSQEPGEIGRLGPYRVLKVLGAGGMGVVFQAEDAHLDRLVALKAILPGLASSASARQRFLREARAAAAIEHEHIVRIYQVGEDRGVPFLAMQFLKGESLDDRLKREGKLPAAEVLRIGREMAEGLAAAHERGLIHRDIKPANVWLEESPGRQSRAGRVKLLDFGLARAVADNAQVTQSGAIVGTPAFMSPEQVSGRAIDARCDLFSLGCVLYRLSAGELPFKGTDTISTIMAVATAQPVPPDELNPDVPPPLSDLVMHLLAKNPDEHPPSARAVVEAIEAIEAELGPGADPSRRPARRQKGRKKALAFSVPALLAPWRRYLVVGVVVVLALAVYRLAPLVFRGDPLSGWRRENLPPAALAWAGKGDPEKVPPELVAVLGDARFRVVGITSWPAFSPDGKLLAVPCGGDVLLFDAGTGRYLRSLIGYGGRVYRLAFSPDGEMLASSNWESATVKLWDLATGRDIRTLSGHTERILGLAFSPDGKILATGSSDRTLRLWRVADGQPGPILAGHTGEIFGVAFSPDQETLASGGCEGTVRVWEAATGKLKRTLPHDNVSQGLGVAFSPDGKFLAGGTDGRLKLWDAGTFEEIHSLPTAAQWLAFTPDSQTLPTAGHSCNAGMVPTVRRWESATGKLQATLPLSGREGWVNYSLSPDGRALAVVRTDNRVVRLHDAVTGQPHFPSVGHTEAVMRVAFSPGGQTLASCAAEYTVKVWDLATGKELRTLVGHTQPVRYLAFSPDGKLLASSSVDKTIKLWDMADGQEPRTLSGHTADVEDLAFSPDGQTLASASRDKTVRLWDVAGGVERRILWEHTAPLRGLAISRDGQTLAAGGADGGVQLWDLAAGGKQKTLQHPTAIHALVFFPDGQTLATATAAGTVTLWSWPTGTQTQTLFGPSAEVTSLAVRADGRRLAASGLDGSARVWDLEANPPRRQTFQLYPMFNWVHGVAFSPKGQHLATANPDGLVYLLRLPETLPAEEAGEVRRLEGLQRPVCRVLCCPDGRHALSSSADGMLRLWDLQTGAVLRVFEGHSGYIWGLTLSPDAKRVLSGGDDQTVRLWDLETGKELRCFRNFQASVTSVAFSPEGRHALVSKGSADVGLWDLETDKELRRFEGHAGEVRGVAFSPNGRQALSGSLDRTVRLWDVETGKELRRFEGHAREVWAVAFSPDGRLVLSGSDDRTVRLWDVETHKELKRFEGHSGAVRAVAFSPDGRRALSGEERTMRLWDVETGKELRRFEGHQQGVSSVIFCRDGLHALSGSWDCTVRLWRLEDPDRQPKSALPQWESSDIGGSERCLESASAEPYPE